MSNENLQTLLVAVQSHGVALEKIKTGIMPAIRSLLADKEANENRIQTLETEQANLLKVVTNLTEIVNSIASQPQVAPTIEIPPTTAFDAGSFDLGLDAPVAQQEQPQVVAGSVAPEAVQAQVEEQEQDGPLCDADIPLPNPYEYVKDGTRVRANRADYFLVWDYKQGNPSATQADIADYLGISRHTVSKYMNMTAKELNELPDYRTDDLMTKPQAQPQAQAQPQVQPQAQTQPQIQQVQPQVQPQAVVVEEVAVAQEPQVDATKPAQDYPTSVTGIEGALSDIIGKLGV